LEDIDSPEIVRNWIAKPPVWLEKRAIGCEPDPALGFLDRGEQEAIALAEGLKADRLIADETEARTVALRRNLTVIGTLGVLRDGARTGLLNLSEAFTRLERTSFYVSQSLIRSFLEGEAALRRECG
jgi:hypothetical protein